MLLCSALVSPYFIGCKVPTVDLRRRAFLFKVFYGFVALFFVRLFAKFPLINKVFGTSDIIDVVISDIKPGEVISVEWRGDPVFIRRRTKEEMIALTQNATSEWVVLIGVCTHLGCIPVQNNAGWICPCHDSQFDSSGHVLWGPARKDLNVPPYRFVNDYTIRIGEGEAP